MTTTDIFAIKSDEEFSQAAIDTFNYQYAACAVYRWYVDMIGVVPEEVTSVQKIPFLPIELYKNHEVTTFPYKESQIVFTSSGTTGSLQSRHYVKDLSLYERSFMEGFQMFYCPVEDTNIFALLPGYLEREGSSLIYMIDKMIEKSYDGGFFLHNTDELIDRINGRDRSKKTLLFGVTFALLDVAERGDLSLDEDVIVMETGGMKGRRREIPRNELHRILCTSLGVSRIHSEYGMCECLSQSYSSGDGVFISPPWMRIMIRDLHDPFRYLENGKRGGINIIDLANRYSCSFIETQDLGLALSERSFTVEGRISGSDIRGCNLLV